MENEKKVFLVGKVSNQINGNLAAWATGVKTFDTLEEAREYADDQIKKDVEKCPPGFSIGHTYVIFYENGNVC